MSYDSSSPPSRSTPVSSSTATLPPATSSTNTVDDASAMPSIPLPSSSSANYDPFFASTFDDGCAIYPPNNNNMKKGSMSSFDPTIYQNSFASHFTPAGVPYPFYSDAATSYFSSQARSYSDYLCQPPYRSSTAQNTMAANPISPTPANANTSTGNSWYQPSHCTDPRFASKKKKKKPNERHVLCSSLS